MRLGKPKSAAITALVVCVVLLVGGCGGNQPSSGSESKQLTIGISSPNLAHPWQKLLADTCKEEVEKSGNKAIVMDAQNRIDKQISDIEDLITKRVDAILISANDGKGVIPAVEEANKAGIPVLALTRRIEGGKIEQLICADNVKGGELAAKFLAEKLGGKGKVALIEGAPGASSSTDRAKGFKQELTKYPDIQLVYDQPGGWQRDKGLNLTENLLQAHPDVKGIFYECDDMGIGGLQAIQAAGKLGKIAVISFDGIKECLQLIRDGKYDATIYNDAASIGRIAVESALKVKRGEKVDPYVSPPMPVLTKDNVGDYLK